MRKLGCYVIGIAFIAAAGCSSDPAPVQGDNPASASSMKANEEQIQARGNPFPRTTAAPGAGRVGGNVMDLPK